MMRGWEGTVKTRSAYSFAAQTCFIRGEFNT
jgi:hypothetical protein